MQSLTAMFTKKTVTLLPLLAATLSRASCDDFRGVPSDKPPIHPVLDMDFQPKVRAQSEHEFEGWEDGRGARRPVADAFGNTLVVAKGSLPNADLAHKDANGQYVTENPLSLDHKFMVRGKAMSTIDRGKEQFEIYCSVCHGRSGLGGNGPKGHGAVGRRWPVAVPNFHVNKMDGADNRGANLPVGDIFETITTGKGTTMPGYGARISVEDRWAIIHYVRARQSLSN